MLKGPKRSFVVLVVVVVVPVVVLGKPLITRKKRTFFAMLAEQHVHEISGIQIASTKLMEFKVCP